MCTLHLQRLSHRSGTSVWACMGGGILLAKVCEAETKHRSKKRGVVKTSEAWIKWTENQQQEDSVTIELFIHLFATRDLLHMLGEISLRAKKEN